MASDLGMETENLTKRYGDLVALRGVSLRIRKGEFFSLLGPNGAGKSTFQKIISCRILPTEGSARVMGLDVVHDMMKVKQIIGVVPQETILYDKLNAKETIDFFGRLYHVRRSDLADRRKFLLKLVALEDRSKDLVETYSGGMKRRLNIAASLVHDPDFLLLDEPTVGLDVQTRHAIWDILKDLRREGKTILLSTHYMEEAESLSDRVAVMDQGKVIALDTPAELKSHLREKNIVEIGLKSPPPGLEKQFGTIEGVDSVSVSEKSIRCVVENARKILPGIVDETVKLGLGVDAIHIAEPTLEDVFVHLTGRSLRE